LNEIAAPGQLKRSALEIMFPLPWPLIALYLLFELFMVAICTFLFTVLLNLTLKTPPQRYLLSTIPIALVVYIITVIILIEILPPLRWVNTVPQDTRTWLWDHIHLLAGAVAFICIALWQLFIRTKRKLTAARSA
jgi:hypothetical protein